MRWTRLVLTLILPAALGLIPSSHADETGSAMADAARRFVAALDEGQKAQATFAYDSPERFNWHWIPRERKGLPFKALNPGQRPLAFGLLNTGLSTRGEIKATTIMSLEEVLRVDEHGTGPVRDSELYYVSVFGNPDDAGEWAWRIEGHHLALNFTLRAGKVISATPFMFGSNPAEIRKGPRKGLRNLADIENPANKLILSLNEDQRKLAIVNTVAPDVTTTPNSARATVSTPEGISVDKLDAEQRSTLSQLVRTYATVFASPVSTELTDQIARGESSMHFAWFGSTDVTKPHAFRVQSSTFYIDFNDTQNDTNHIHTFYRSLLGDFGAPPK